jgi:hypothetical protein
MGENTFPAKKEKNSQQNGVRELASSVLDTFQDIFVHLHSLGSIPQSLLRKETPGPVDQ